MFYTLCILICMFCILICIFCKLICIFCTLFVVLYFQLCHKHHDHCASWCMWALLHKPKSFICQWAPDKHAPACAPPWGHFAWCTNQQITCSTCTKCTICQICQIWRICLKHFLFTKITYWVAHLCLFSSIIWHVHPPCSPFGCSQSWQVLLSS